MLMRGTCIGKLAHDMQLFWLSEAASVSARGWQALREVEDDNVKFLALKRILKG